MIVKMLICFIENFCRNKGKKLELVQLIEKIRENFLQSYTDKELLDINEICFEYLSKNGITFGYSTNHD